MVNNLNFETYLFISSKKFIISVKSETNDVYNILMETPNVVLVNNLIVETLHPRNEIAILYNGLTSNNEIRKEKMDILAKKRLMYKEYKQNIVVYVSEKNSKNRNTAFSRI